MSNPALSPARKKSGLPLIVGAGPAGLTTALMLARENIPVRVIDRNPAPVAESRALILHHRTLDLLRETGVGEKLISHGHALRGIQLTIAGENRAQARFDFFPHAFKGLLVLPQAITERVLLDAFRQLGGIVDRNTEFVGARLEGDGGNVDIRTGEATELTRVSWLIGADGADSSVRASLDVGVSGTRPESFWSMADVVLNGDVEQSMLEVCLAPEAPVLIRIPQGRGRHRVMSNAAGVIDMIPEHWEPRDLLWSGDHRFYPRLADRRLVGRGALIGDAAHTHSPIGFRGINLGIEDAVTLSRLVRETSSITTAMVSKEVEEQIKNELRGWERERQQRARVAHAAADHIQAVLRGQTRMQRLSWPLSLRFIRHFPSLQRELIALLTEFKGA